MFGYSLDTFFTLFYIMFFKYNKLFVTSKINKQIRSAKPGKLIQAMQSFANAKKCYGTLAFIYLNFSLPRSILLSCTMLFK